MKPYVKPELYFECFELAQHIAACAWDMTNDNDGRSCTAKWDTSFGESFTGESIFNYDACTIQESVNEGIICYTSCADIQKVFAS